MTKLVIAKNEVAFKELKKTFMGLPDWPGLYQRLSGTL